jgi:hypothetical protein
MPFFIRDSELILIAIKSSFKVKIAEALKELAGPLKLSFRAIKKKYSVYYKTLKRHLNGHVLRRLAR